MAPERLDKFALDNDWTDIEGDPITDRAGLGSDLVDEYGTTPAVFRYLQTLIVGEGVPLPQAPPSVRIVLVKDGWKEDYALVYGFPSAGTASEPGSAAYLPQATSHPEEAAQFKIFYGANYGPGGYSRVEIAQALDPEREKRFKSGDFTDQEAEQLLAEKDRLLDIYWELNVAARDPQLNPDYAERVTDSFYRNAA